MARLAFITQNRGFKNWLVSYKMFIPPCLHEKDFLVFHRKIEDELLKVIREESNELGPLKFNYTMLVKLRKDTNKGEEDVESFLRQSNSERKASC